MKTFPVMRSLAFMTAVLLGGHAAAATYKCTANGQSVYSDQPCGGNITVLSAPATSGYGSAAARNIYSDDLRAKIAEAIARRDFPHAESLAVSEGDWNMIAAAKREIAQDAAEAKARKRESRPINCYSFSTPAGGANYRNTYTSCR